MLFAEIPQGLFVFVGQEMPRADVLPAAEDLEDVAHARMPPERRAVGLDCHRAVPGGGTARPVFDEIGLGPAVVPTVWEPEAPPAEIEPGEVLAHPGRFFGGIAADHLLEDGGREDVKGVAA